MLSKCDKLLDINTVIKCNQCLYYVFNFHMYITFVIIRKFLIVIVLFEFTTSHSGCDSVNVIVIMHCS